MAHRVISLRCGIWSLPGHRGHGWADCCFDPVAFDPQPTSGGSSSLSDSGIQPGGNDRYVTGKRQTGRSSSGAEAILGLLEPAVGSAPGWASSQAGIRTNMRLMFHAMVTRLHSPRTFSRPRIENWPKPITDLMMPHTGSGVCW